jgi:hypothetical protein
MAPKRKSSDAGSASNPKRSRDFLSISEKVRILDVIEIEKKNPSRRLPCCMVYLSGKAHKSMNSSLNLVGLNKCIYC